MSLKKIKVYAYKNRKPIGSFESISEAARAFNSSISAVYASIRKRKPIRNGNVTFSVDTPSEEELNVGQDNDDEISEDSFLLQRTREDRIKEFRKFIFQRFNQRWMRIDKKVARMEAAYVKAFLNSL